MADQGIDRYKSDILEQLHFGMTEVWFLLTHGLDYAF
jgi:hypothetical protein